MNDTKASYWEDRLTRAKTRFTSPGPTAAKDFQSEREDWDRLRNRNWPTELQPELAADQEGIDYETPDLEKALGDHIDILKMNPTVFDVIPLSERKSDKERAREILLWHSRAWETEDEGRHWDIGNATGQVAHGVKFQRHLWRDDEGKPDSDEDDETSAEEQIEARNATFRRKRHPFYWQGLRYDSCYWLGDDQSEEGPDVFFYEYELPYMDMQQTYARRGQDEKLEYPTLAELNKLTWVGEPVSVDNGSDLDSVRVVVVDHKTSEKCPLPYCTHKQRKITTFVCGRDGYINQDSVVEDIDSPFPNCSFYVIGGRMNLGESDPALKFRPLMHGLYVESYWVNYLTTFLATATRKDYGLNRMYLDVSAVQNPSLLPQDDAANNLIDFPSPVDGQIAFFPGEIKRLPSEISQHAVALLQAHRERLAEYKPNRFVTGQAYTEASNATGTAFIQQAQQAALPYDTLLAESDRAIVRSRKAEDHAIRYWALGEPEDLPTRYYAVMTGDQANVKIKGEAPKQGQVVYMTAEKLSSIDYDLVIKTKSETLAEEGARWLQAKDQYSMGAITPEQLVRSTGADDITGQFEKLDAAWMQALTLPIQQQMAQQMILRWYYGLTGTDFGGQGVSNGAAPPQQQQPQGPATPSPAGAPQGSSQNNGASVTAPNQLMGRSMQQATIQGPEGGSNPMR